MIDFLIIGGGIAGVSAAARLAGLGSVTLLEAEDALGYHTSGRSAAMFEESYGSRATVALNRASKDYLQHADGGVLSERGLMLLAGRDDRAAFERDMAALAMQPMSAAEAVAMVPVLDAAAIARAGFHAEAWDIDTDRLLQGFARRARSRGARLHLGTRATGISRANRCWEVTAGEHGFQARILINAAGAWADRVAAMAGVAPVGLTPLRRSMARIPAPGGHELSDWPMLLGAGEAWYAKPDAGKLLVSPGDEDPAEPHDAWADDMVIAEGLARYEAFVTTPVTRVETTWAGLRTFAPDRNLVIGRDPAEPEFLWLAGQGGYGMQSAPAASRLLADIVSGAQPDLGAAQSAAMSPARF